MPRVPAVSGDDLPPWIIVPLKLSEPRHSGLGPALSDPL